ncbi:TonB family protein [Rufibacter glacialis]|uniref:M56 family metallopeptidase n=1 Tax=Rufibacter glacialis TaxID=1259555 RepID=A0A5M8QR05_9BACT|nr:M56 family metallopeptidase [Rufibacter glacialis]KAA6437434.1 M56 family metallopeptidase [Rufibacter glacialis]GGK59315.1 hypothetical protein GCM10011405_04310 [Rufibacter glacialis]
MNEPLLQYLLESGTGLVLLYLFYAVVLKKETCFQFNRFYLIAALLLSFVLPLSNLPGLDLWPQQETAAPEVMLVEMPLVATEVLVAPEEPLDYWPLLYGIYGLGVLFLTGRFLRQTLRLRRFAREHGVSFYLPNRAPVFLTYGQLPTFSFWRWVFFDNSQTLTPSETERILQHEQVHLDQRHTLDVLLVSMASIVFWFNPLLVLYKKALEHTHEFIADAHVARTAGAASYSSLLVKQVFRNADFTLGSYFFLNKSLTLTRIKMMKRLHESPKLSRMLLAVPVLALLLVAVAAMRPAPLRETETSGKEIALVQNGPAQFPGGREALNTYVKSNLVLPEIAYQKRKSPKDFVKVTATLELEVGEDGTPVYRRATALDVRPQDPAVAKAVERQFTTLVSQMPKWVPAQKEGKAVSSKETISVSVVGGDFLNYASYLANRQQKTTVSSQAVTTPSTVSKPAEFPGGEEALYQHLNSQFVLPRAVLEAKGSSDSTVKFLRHIKAELLVGVDGRVSQARVLEVNTRPYQSQEVRQAVEKEFMRIATHLPTWAPAFENGAPIASKVKVEFATFTKLPGKGEAESAKKGQEKEAEVPPKDDRVFIAVDQMPEFPGGQAAMFQYLGKNFSIPADARDAKVEGVMVASFIVNAQGKVTDVQVMKKLTPSLDKELIKTLQNMPLWKPGTQNGKPVNVKYTVPYRIALKEETSVVAKPDAQNEEKVYIAVQQMPEFPGGQAAMFKFLAENFKIPAQAKAEGTNGSIVVSCVITKEGRVTRVKVEKGLSPSLDQEAIRATSAMPNWEPGIQNGKAVAVKVTTPYRIVVPKE